jgi:RNA polymerase sigma-70 factor (ECF subfamily)
MHCSANLGLAEVSLLALAPPPLPKDLALDPANDLAAPPPSRSRTIVEINASTSDPELVRAAIERDPRAYAAILQKHERLVRARVRRSISAADADDCVQEVFMRLFQRIDQLRDPNALRSFIVGITLHVVGTELRRYCSSNWLQLTPSGDVVDDAYVDAPDESCREALERLNVILGKLGPHARRVFELRYIGQLELSDIATEMNVSLATVKRHLARVVQCVAAMVAREPALAEFAGDLGKRHVKGKRETATRSEHPCSIQS